MTSNGWLQIGLFSLIVVLITRPFGGYMTRVFAGERTFLSPLLRPVERLVYWCCGVDETEEQSWLIYAVSMLFFGLAGFVTLYALQRLQWYLPFNPQGQAAVEQVLAFNTSVSFVTNTNWQSYVPETTMGYLVQMAGLTVHNFVSAAVGIALAIALIRQCDPDRGRDEIMDREPRHLNEIAHRRLRHVGLPVRVSDKAHRGVERQHLLDRCLPLRVERQIPLQALQHVERDEAGGAEKHHRHRIGAPRLLLGLVDAATPVYEPFEGTQERPQRCPLACENARHVAAERPCDRDDDQSKQRDLQPSVASHRASYSHSDLSARRGDHGSKDARLIKTTVSPSLN